jgi:hypothetical protein
MVRIITITACLAALGTAALGQPMNLSSDPNANDSTYQELNRIINDQSNCLAKEAQSDKLTNSDVEVAAHTVLANCAIETQRYKVYIAKNFPGDPSQFEKWWNEKEQDSIEYVEKVIAMVRTQKD